MAQKSKTPEAGVQVASSNANNGKGQIPPELAELSARVDLLLGEGKVEKALDTVARAGARPPWTTNMLGVCQLRLGNAETAVSLFRGLVLSSGGLILRTDIPVVYKTNYATALLLAGNVSGCQRVLAEVNNEQNPSVHRLREAIRRWVNSMTYWQRVNWWTGGTPKHPVTLHYPPGDLE